MSDVSFGTRWGIVLPPPSPKVPSHGRQSDSLLCQTGSMEAALQLRRAAVSLGRGVVAHEGTLFSNQRK